MNFVVLKMSKCSSKKRCGVKIVVGRRQELYVIDACHIINTEILFSVFF